MNSKTLKETGFTEFSPIKGLSLSNLPSTDGQVFVLIDTTLSDKPSSDILYIGRARKPAKKIFGGYIGGSGGKTTKKIHKALFNEGYIEKVCVGWMAADNPKTRQKEFLEKFKNEHGGYPPWNPPAKATKKPKPTPKPAGRSATRKTAAQKTPKTP